MWVMSEVGKMNATHSFPVKGYDNSETTMKGYKHFKAGSETFNRAEACEWHFLNNNNLCILALHREET